MFHTGSINHFILNRQGGVAIIFSLLLIPMMCIASMALDYSRALHLKSRITQATDAALLSAANVVMQEIRLSKIDETSRKKVDDMLAEQFESFFEANMKGTIQHERRDAIIDYDLKTQKVTVNVKANYPVLMFERIASLLPSRKDAPVVEDWGLSVTAATYMKAEEKNSASIFFVFDQSISMDSTIEWKSGPRKIDALKKAVNELIASLEKQNTDSKKFIRAGAISYDHEIKSKVSLDWKFDDLKKLIADLAPDGSTNIALAMKKAHDTMQVKTEQDAHKQENGVKPNLAIILMTDGANFDKKNDPKTLDVCSAIRRKGARIYSIAFGAHTDGKALLRQCASGKNYYYESDNAKELALAYRHIGERVLGKNLALYE